MTHPSHVIAAPELARLIGRADCPPIFDVRRAQAFDAAPRLIAGARWRDHARLDDWASECAGPVVLYCVHGHQVSQAATARLRARGIDAHYLEGGYDAFAAAGGTTIARPDAVPELARATTRWITRERPKVDRLACPWFVRRFVDRDAEILYVEADWVREAATEAGAIPFDIPDTAFSHSGELCSFDAFMDAFGIEDSALWRLALVVRGADTARPELAPQCGGLLAMSLGLSSAFADDHVTLSHAMVLYDALYAWARNAADETHNWPAGNAVQ